MSNEVLNIQSNVKVAEAEKPISDGRGFDNAIYISDKAKTKVVNLMNDAGLGDDASYFLRVGVVGGGCSGLSYKMDFDNEQKPMDQAFEDKGMLNYVRIPNLPGFNLAHIALLAGALLLGFSILRNTLTPATETNE